MKGLSVIIPSRNIANLRPCIEAVRKHEPDVQIIVIWDAPKIGDPGIADLWAVQSLINAYDGDGMVLRGVQPFIFARNCNLGIEAAGDHDIVLLNDDALLESSGGFSTMQRAAEDNPQYGLISATTNVAGNPAQHRQGTTGLRLCGKTPGNSCPVVAFVCVLIPRRTINLVGMLDERFGGMTPEGKRIYGFDDNDLCRRVHQAGQYIGICDGCFVEHGKLKSSFRSEPHDMDAARKIYVEKWGNL